MFGAVSLRRARLFHRLFRCFVDGGDETEEPASPPGSPQECLVELEEPIAMTVKATLADDDSPENGTVTLIEMCSGSVGFVALVVDQRWVVWHFRRQSRARRPDSRPRSDQPFRFAIGSR